MGKIVRNGIEFSSTIDNASNVNYNNSLSGLEAVTTQGAIDEVCENVSTLTESLEMKKTDLADGLYVVHNNSFAILSFNIFNVSANSGSWVKVCTLPEHIRPFQLTRGVVVDNLVNSYANNASIPVLVNNYGEVYVYVFQDHLSADVVGQVVYSLK